ncbi:AAA family ATPase [Streptomyces sp. NPDC057579]|uniref:AAA family ATPase n=1 Tax=Streptomyces sp. NPDC057579 TaxID=3346172 RepID=UPI0036D1C6A4
MIICLDALRREIGGEGNQAVTAPAVARQNALLDKHLSTGDKVFLDSTNVEVRVRADLVERARRHRRPIVAVRFMADPDTCHARNRRRPVTQQQPHAGAAVHPRPHGEPRVRCLSRRRTDRRPRCQDHR